jgi:hypothetical protein
VGNSRGVSVGLECNVESCSAPRFNFESRSKRGRKGCYLDWEKLENRGKVGDYVERRLSQGLRAAYE